jgi:hypothetical protein
MVREADRALSQSKERGRTWPGSDCGHSFHGVAPDPKANQEDTMPTINR